MIGCDCAKLPESAWPEVVSVAKLKSHAKTIPAKCVAARSTCG